MATPTEKLDLRSMSITGEKHARLKELFPEVFTEGGKVDFDRLRLVLGETVDVGKERYGMVWPGKADCFKTIQRPSVATLRPVREESVNFDATENVIIEGDNLEVLKLLQKAYLGKVKMIYIDPPYNTGNDFIYPDNYTESLQTYLEYTGQTDNEGRKFSTNTEVDGRFHSKWLNMMYPRLFLAKNLLRDDGVVFISIDDGELDNLKKTCNEIFGEENFIATFIWEKRTNRENRKTVSSRHDYIVCYCREVTNKEKALKLLPMSEEALSRYKNPDNDPRGSWKSDPAHAQAGHGTKSQFYVLEAPNGKKHELPGGRCWLYTKDVMNEAIRDGRIWFGQDGNGVPRIKTYLDHKDRGLTPESIWFASDASTNEGAKTALKDLFDGNSVFETPKPVELIKLCMRLCAEEGIILDFFAGSGTTAHATLELNREDGGQRRFVLVQLPEPTGRQDYPTISSIVQERTRRVIKALEEQDAEKLPLGNQPPQDHGFRVFKLDSSNFTLWNGMNNHGKSEEVSELKTQLELHINNIQEGRSSDDLLFELLVKSGFPPTTRINVLELEGFKVHSVAQGAMLVYLQKKLTNLLVKAIVDRKPERAIFLDEAFAGSDELKTNTVQLMKSKGIVFRTV
jgi:adenine-specific DNA-methyltransferase